MIKKVPSPNTITPGARISTSEFGDIGPIFLLNVISQHIVQILAHIATNTHLLHEFFIEDVKKIRWLQQMEMVGD